MSYFFTESPRFEGAIEGELFVIVLEGKGRLAGDWSAEGAVQRAAEEG